MRSLLVIAMLALQLPLGAQTPLRYRYVSTSTTTTEKTAFDTQVASLKASGLDVTEIEKTNGVSINKTISLVSLTTRDSAGGTIWQMTIDTTWSEYGPMMQAQMKRITVAPPPARGGSATPPAVTPRPAPPKTVNQVFVLNGKAVSFERNGRPSATPIVPQHPAASLWAQLPGYALLIPNADLPLKIGEVKADTFGTHTKIAATSGSVVSSAGLAGSAGSAGSGAAGGSAGAGLSARGVSAGGSGGGSITLPGSPAREVSDTTVTEWKRSTADAVDASMFRQSTSESTQSYVSTEVIGTYRIVFDANHAVHDASSTATTTTTTLNTQTAAAPTVSTRAQEYSLVRIP